MTDPLEHALAEIAKLGAAAQARNDRIATDPVINKLDEFIAIWRFGLPREGSDGAVDVVTQLTSARHWMVKRAQALRVARAQQLSGRPATFWLAKAANCRKSEKAYRRAERREEYTRAIMDAAGLRSVPAVAEVA